MTTTPLTDQRLADGHLLDLIQAEVDSKPPHYYRFNGGLYVPKVLPLAQALRADRDRLAAELGRVRAELATAREQVAALSLVPVRRCEDGREYLAADDVRTALNVPTATAVPGA